jgi:hypothetical protein
MRTNERYDRDMFFVCFSFLFSSLSLSFYRVSVKLIAYVAEDIVSAEILENEAKLCFISSLNDKRVLRETKRDEEVRAELE